MKCTTCRKKIIGLRVQVIHPTMRKLLGTYCPECAEKLERARPDATDKGGCIAMTTDHLDIMDSRRNDLFADAEHHDCEHYLSGMCGNDEYVVAQLLADAKEGNPDASYAGLVITIRPEWGGAANHCPGLWPSLEYLRELKDQDHDAALTYREDMNRRSAVIMGAQS